MHQLSSWLVLNEAFLEEDDPTLGLFPGTKAELKIQTGEKFKDSLFLNEFCQCSEVLIRLHLQILILVKLDP